MKPNILARLAAKHSSWLSTKHMNTQRTGHLALCTQVRTGSSKHSSYSHPFHAFLFSIWQSKIDSRLGVLSNSLCM